MGLRIVKQAEQNDADVSEYKVRQAQAERRAKARQAIEAKTKTISKDGLTVRYNAELNKCPVAKALAKALS